jgi:hypothetical protein
VIPRLELLRRYDAEMRRDPPPIPGTRFERHGPVVRAIGEESGVVFSDLSAANARACVAAEAEFFRGQGVAAEWKLYGHDQPPELPELLAAAGFVAGEPETLMARDLSEGLPEGPTLSGVVVRRATDPTGARDAAAANEAAFGSEGRKPLSWYVGLIDRPDEALFVAYAEDRPVASGRLELPPGRAFAGLYGGGTAVEFRGRGVYRALVRARTALAFERGYRYATVDAQETSRPILERSGFVAITTTRPWVLR